MVAICSTSMDSIVCMPMIMSHLLLYATISPSLPVEMAGSQEMVLHCGACLVEGLECKVRLPPPARGRQCQQVAAAVGMLGILMQLKCMTWAHKKMVIAEMFITLDISIKPMACSVNTLLSCIQTD